MFSCTHCDAQYSKWTGRCLECGKWGAIVQAAPKQETKGKKQDAVTAPATTVSLKDLKAKDVERKTTGISELDRVLGGGIVPGALLLLGGEPGIGKSTLSIQLASILSPTLYISGEESVAQIKLRADRLGLTAERLELANETDVDTIAATILKNNPTLCVVDSIQTITSSQATGETGSVSQIRACTATLMQCAKSTGTAVVIIGHVTKDGSVAGPKTLEHLVDTVLYLEGDRHHGIRLLRTVKNRFGATDEVGLFEMVSTGLKEIPNPSAYFLEDRGEDMPGSVMTCLLEGTRPILIEIQALVNKTSFGYPVRKSSGFDLNRLHVLVAVLEKRAGLTLGQYDIHVNVVGGMKANEPAADLAVCLAIASSFKDKALGKDLVVFGEVGLGGEVRRTQQLDRRVKESAQLGMKRAILPANTTLSSTELKLISVKNIEELITKA